MRRNKRNSALKSFYQTSLFYLEGLRQKDAQYFRHYVNLVRSQTNSDAVVLELGSGTGLSSYLLAQTGVNGIRNLEFGIRNYLTLDSGGFFVNKVSG